MDAKKTSNQDPTSFHKRLEGVVSASQAFNIFIGRPSQHDVHRSSRMDLKWMSVGRPYVQWDK